MYPEMRVSLPIRTAGVLAGGSVVPAASTLPAA